MTEDPFQPPNASGDLPDLADECPRCGAQLEDGRVPGEVFWHAEDDGFFRRHIMPKRLAGYRSFSLTRRTLRRKAMKCPSCDLLLILPERI